jgi:hypothetical protein
MEVYAELKVAKGIIKPKLLDLEMVNKLLISTVR